MLDQLSSAAEGEGSRKIIGIVAANRSRLDNLIYSTPRMDRGSSLVKCQPASCQLLQS